MELREFVAETLKQIVGGARDATESGTKVAETNYISVDFDVAVTSSEEVDHKKKAGVFVWSVVKAGVEGSSATSNSSVSRVKFTIPLLISTLLKQ